MTNYMMRFFHNMKFTDIVDIVIIGVFIYIVLVWFKRARVRFIFIGMLMLGIVYVMAQLFGLYLTTVALQAFFTVSLIVIVIIFQDDLRHFFERIAIAGVGRTHRAVSPSTASAEILTSTLANLSRKRIGALIVVRGLDPLDRHLETGIVLDGLVSQILLESIFDRHVPSHDGAVIIDGGRITKFGCYLPLSTNIKEVGRLGTRHAAALGITERSDSISLVVSEEDGGISVAENGRIAHQADPARLTHILQNFYHRNFPEKRRLRPMHLFTKHYLEKAVAIILACSLWVIFGHQTDMVRRDFVIPIEYRNLAPDRIIEEPKVKEVAVTLSGTEQEFNLLKSKELKLSLDTSGFKDGDNKVSLSKDLVRNASGLVVVNIHPKEILLASCRMVPLTIPIEIKTKGRLPSDVVLKSIKVEPSSASVLVPSTLPKDKASVVTDIIDLGAVTQTTTITPILIASPEVRFAGDRPPEPKIIVEVERKGG